VNSGAGDKKMTLDETTEKFLQNTALAIPEAQAMRIRQAVIDLEHLELADLSAVLRGGAA
jgi:hypothetical protein